MSSWIEIDGPGLEQAQRVVIVIHGMATTVETLKMGYPAPPDGTITKVYWRLPILRESAEAVRIRRDDDVFGELFAPIIEAARVELKDLIRELDRPSVGLFGFSIGSLIALWGAVENPAVKAVVAVGGVPSLQYLTHYYPTYPWAHPDVEARLTRLDVAAARGRLSETSTLICHGEADDVARWEWMRNFADDLVRDSNHAEVARFPHVRHRLTSDDPAEARELIALRERADAWFVNHLGTPS